MYPKAATRRAEVRMSMLFAAGRLRRGTSLCSSSTAFRRSTPARAAISRDLRVLWALEEMRLPFELAGLDRPAHDLNTEAYRRLSPFEQIPSIDDDGLVLSESAAILVYRAKKTGRLISGDRAGEAQVVRWCSPR